MNILTHQQRNILAILIMVCVAIVVSSLDIFLPALPLMRDYFGTTEYTLQLALIITPLTSALLSLGFGRLCDVYGRRSIMLTSFVFFLVGGLGCCISQTVNFFIISRFIQSIGTTGVSIVAVVVIADMFQGIHYARYMAIYGALFPLTFATSPIVGAQITEYFGWRATFIFNVSSMIIVGSILRTLLPETLIKREKGDQGGFKELLLRSKKLLWDREFVFMGIGHALPISLTGIFFANGSFIFIDGFAYTPSQYSFLQGIPIAFNVIGSMIYRRYIAILGIKGALWVGITGFCGFILTGLALLTHQLPNSPLFILSAFCLSNFAMPFIVATCATRAFEIFPEDRGLSVSIVSTLRNLCLAILVSVTGLFFDGSIYPIYTVMILICLIVIAIILSALHQPLEAYAKK